MIGGHRSVGETVGLPLGDNEGDPLGIDGLCDGLTLGNRLGLDDGDELGEIEPGA